MHSHNVHTNAICEQRRRQTPRQRPKTQIERAGDRVGWEGGRGRERATSAVVVNVAVVIVTAAAKAACEVLQVLATSIVAVSAAVAIKVVTTAEVEEMVLVEQLWPQK